MGDAGTVREWVASQGLEEYNRFNDRILGFLRRCQVGRRRLDRRERALALRMLYHLDLFRTDLVRDSPALLLERSPAERERILGDEAACLEFAYELLELEVKERRGIQD